MNSKHYLKIFLLLFLVGCSESTNEFVFTTLENNVYYIKNFVFYINKNEEVYLYLNNKTERENISKSPIKSVKFNFNDEVIEGKIIDIVFSRELNRSPFIIEVDNKIIAPIKKDDKYMFYLGQKNEISHTMKAAINNAQIMLNN
ncbi:MAG TPA: hypothetical protein PLL09_08265 [Flavobacterium sp.]|uniref:hypothetical protein n=1 Tax=unclassified Flavobacterium TaxID=196869 RepID=UPI0025C53E6D|nr:MULTISPECIES: hypothetical protein [unclassified Flavobacterium]HRE77804.1 hypothetical protein [Flavobacterium sp.]